MDLAWKRIFVGALIGSTALTKVAPRLLPGYKISLSPKLCFFVLYITLLILAFTWKVILYPRLFSSMRHLPRPSGGSFLHGQFHAISEDMSGNLFQRWIDETPNEGLIYYRYLFNAERIFVTSPKALAEVLVHKSYDFIKPEMMVGRLRRILGVGVFLAEGDEHKIQRKNLMPAFQSRHVKDLYAIFWSKSREMVEAVTETVNEKGPAHHVEDAPVIELGSWTRSATLDIIGLACLGQDFNSMQEPNSELNQAYRIIFASHAIPSALLVEMSHFLPIGILDHLPSKQNREVAAAIIKIRSICRKQISSKKERISAQKDSGVDILAVALRSGAFTDENLVDQMMTFLAAGHEANAITLNGAIYTLARYPDIQSRLRAEIRAHLPPLADTITPVTASMLDSLPFLHAVCNEILRLHPPVIVTLREAVRDTTIQGTLIPKGTLFTICPYAVNLSSSLWGPDSQVFNPERWLGNNSGGAESNYSFLSFLHGPRGCMGQAFAKAELACLLAAVVGRFEFVPEYPEAEVKLQGGIITKPKTGALVKVRVVEGW